MTIHDVNSELDDTVVIRVSIEDEHNENGYKIHRDVTMKPNATVVASIALGELSYETDYKLCVKGISGIELDDETILYHLNRTHLILVQTDKSTYKPNDCVKFRVLILDSELKPASFDQRKLIITFAVSNKFE